VRRIHKEMPHLTAAEVAEVASNMPKELYLEGAEQIAKAKAMAQIGGII
jgi:hypothetical protein